MDLLKSRLTGFGASLSSISSSSNPSSASSSNGYHSGDHHRLPPVDEFSHSTPPFDFHDLCPNDPGRMFADKLSGYLSQILENENKEKETNARQQQTSLKAQERSMQELKQSQVSALQEKEALIQKLTQSLANKDRDLSEVIRDSPAAATDAVVQQMQASLQDKDGLLEELMSERARAADAHQGNINDLQHKLRQRDQERKEAEDTGKRTEMSLNQQLQHLQTELNEKEFELSKLESRSAWAGEQQQEILDKLKEALNEKNRTIEVLVDSAQEKDKLLSQMRDTSSGPHDTTTASKLAELQKLKDEVAMLSNEMQNKDSLIERLRAANERRSPKLDMVPRHRHQDLEEDLDQRTKALTRALCAEKAAKLLVNELREEIQKHRSVEEHLRNDLNHLQQQLQDSPSKTPYDSFNSFLPSFNPLPDPSLIPDDATLTQMSLPQVRGIIQGLRSQLSSPKRHSSSLMNGDGFNQLREENKQLTSKLHLILYGPASERDVRIIPVLRQELEDAKIQLRDPNFSREEEAELEVYQALIQELKAKLDHTENVNEVLRKQLQMGSHGVANQAAVTAKENKRLKEQVQHLSDAQLQVEALQNTLASTEATVRSQSDKMKHYRSLLEEAGLLTASPLPHGHSEGNLQGSSPDSKASHSKNKKLEGSLQRLRRQQENSAETASALSQRLEEVSEYVSELLHQDSLGEVDVIDITPDRVTQLKQTLNAARSLVAAMQEATDDVDGAASSSSASSSVGDLARIDEPLEELEAERQLLLSKVEVLNAEVLRMQQEVLKERERTNVAEKEMKMAKEEGQRSQEERSKLSEELQEEERSTQKLRTWLKENQAREETLRQELSRMNGEADSQNSTIETLRQKLQALQQQRQQTPPPSPVKDSLSRRSVSPIERARHPTSTSTILDSMHSNGTVQTHSPPSRQGVGELDSLPSTEDHRPTLIEPVFRISDPSPQDLSIAEYAQELSKLKFRLNAMDSLNQSLRQELHVYDNIQNSSVGIQNCPSMSHDASQTFMTDSNNSGFLGLESHLYEIRQLQNTLMESLRQNDALRVQLQAELASLATEPHHPQPPIPSKDEQRRIDILIRDLDLVKTQLSVQTSENRRHQAISEKLEGQLNDSSQRLKSMESEKVAILVRDLDLVKTQLSVQTSENRRHQAISEKLEGQLNEASQRLKSMEAEKVATDIALRVASNEVKRMRSSRDSLKQQLKEQGDLNTTLKLEMSIYEAAGLDDPHSNTGTGHLQHDDKSLNRLLLQQMRQLRKQLEKSIHNNNQLRRDLESYMQQRQTPDHFRSCDEMSSSSRSSRATSPTSSISSKMSFVSRQNGYHSDHDVHRSSCLHSTAVPPHSASLMAASGDTMYPQQYDLLRETSASLPSEAVLSGQIEAHMRYSALDAKRPPSGVGSRLRMSTGSHYSGLSPNRIGSDLRSLYAVGSLDDYELLKKQAAESQSALAAADAIIKERLTSFRMASPSQNIEYNTLRQLSTRLTNLRTISEEERRLVALFWVTQLPVRDEKGNFVDLKMARENKELQRRLLQAQNNVQHLKDGMESAIGKMATDLRLKKESGQQMRKNHQDDRVVDALSAHLKVLCQASRNLESTRDGSKS